MSHNHNANRSLNSDYAAIIRKAEEAIAESGEIELHDAVRVIYEDHKRERELYQVEVYNLLDFTERLAKTVLIVVFCLAVSLAISAKIYGNRDREKIRERVFEKNPDMRQYFE